MNLAAHLISVHTQHKDADAARPAIFDVLKAALGEQKTALQSDFENGNLGGIKAATRLSSICDNLLVSLFDYVSTSVFPSATTSSMALCAVGGYGRGELAPYSDLDLLFLCDGNKDKENCARITEYILYMLWDLGFKIGHATRTPAQCIELGRGDETILTSLLDLRYLAGNKEPVTQLGELLLKERTRARKRKYIQAKLSARDGRHARAGNSRYVIEPNLKEGKGGLRDLHELYWIARFIHTPKNTSTKNIKLHIPMKPHAVDAYLRLGLLDAEAAKRFKAAAEFLWKARFHLHYLVERSADVLSFDRQPELAKRMGYTQGSREQQVEEFMRTYFNTAREVGALTRIACAKLESENALLLPQGLDRILPTTRRGLKEPGFVLDHGRLNFASRATLTKRPRAILDLFRIAGVRNLDIHPNAFFTLSQNMDIIDDGFRDNAEHAEIFFTTMLEAKAPGATLRTMNEAGVLGAYLPEFGSIVGCTQFNMHHAYTVDDHSLSLISFLHDIESGHFKDVHPFSTDFVKTWTPRLRLCVYLACLLHDTGKGKGDQCIEGAAQARTACRRLGLADQDTDTVAWLVRNHLEMSETAQRRDLSDPATISHFALLMGSVTRLQMLLVLTVVDIRAVGPGIWNDWKGELLRELYDKSAAHLMGEEQKIDPKANEINDLIDALPEDAFSARDTEHDVYIKCERDKDITQAWVLTHDRTHLFSDLTGAISAAGASVIGARLHTDNAGRVLNTFYLQNVEGLAYGRKHARKLEELHASLLDAAINGRTDAAFPPALPSRRADAIPIRPRAVSVPDGDGRLILEVEGRDRPGLLYGLSHILSTHGLSVRSAHIEVAGPKALDVFYVSYTKTFNEQKLIADLLGVLSPNKVREEALS
jgi:[protein-PII] uridylyltransferase